MFTIVKYGQWGLYQYVSCRRDIYVIDLHVELFEMLNVCLSSLVMKTGKVQCSGLNECYVVCIQVLRTLT